MVVVPVNTLHLRFPIQDQVSSRSVSVLAGTTDCTQWVTNKKENVRGNEDTVERPERRRTWRFLGREGGRNWGAYDQDATFTCRNCQRINQRKKHPPPKKKGERIWLR